LAAIKLRLDLNLATYGNNYAVSFYLIYLLYNEKILQHNQINFFFPFPFYDDGGNRLFTFVKY